MKSYRNVFVVGFITLALCSFYNACSSEIGIDANSTITGNPLKAPASTKILKSLCATIQRCHGTTETSQCEDQVLTQAINRQVGAPSKFSTLASVATAEEKTELLVNSSALENCAVALNSLSCTDPLVLAAFNSRLNNPFSGANNLVPLTASCSEVFALNSTSTNAVANYHYVRAGATGSGDGSDWENACPDFSGPCAGNSMQRGHTYYVATGTYAGVEFSVPGTETITIKKATVTDHGSVIGWQDSYGAGTAIFSGWTFSSGNWVLDGVSRSDLRSGHGFKIDIPSPSPNCPSQFCNAIYLDRTNDIDNISIRYTEIAGFGNSVEGNFNGIYTGAGSGKASNVSFSFGYLHDFGSNGVGFKVVGSGIEGWIFEYSLVERLIGPALEDQGSSNITVRNNLLKDIKATAVIVSENSSGILTTKNMSLYGNIFWMSDPETYGVSNGVIACVDGNICSNWQFVNNTIVNFTGSGSYSGRVRFDQAAPESSGNTVYNNIWFNSKNLGHSGNSLVIDYNLYALSDGYSTEAHDQVLTSDPFVDSVAGNFDLKAATEAGLNFSSPFDFDFMGVRRNQDGVWDRGAFEY